MHCICVKYLSWSHDGSLFILLLKEFHLLGLHSFKWSLVKILKNVCITLCQQCFHIAWPLHRISINRTSYSAKSLVPPESLLSPSVDPRPASRPLCALTSLRPVWKLERAEINSSASAYLASLCLTIWGSIYLKPSRVKLASRGETGVAGHLVSLLCGASGVFLGRFGVAGGFSVKRPHPNLSVWVSQRGAECCSWRQFSVFTRNLNL